jgi:hypothetical protein
MNCMYVPPAILWCAHLMCKLRATFVKVILTQKNCLESLGS